MCKQIKSRQKGTTTLESKPTRFHIRPARPDEAGLFFTQHPAADERLGAIGHVRMDFGKSGNEFWHTWWPRGPEELNGMDDPCLPIAPGTEGEVDFVNDIGSIHMKWDNGRTLALVPGEDSFSVLPPKLTTLKLYMPLTANLFAPNEYGDMDECGELLEGHELRGYQDQITAALVKNRMPEEAERGLMHWYGEADSIDRKVHSAVFTVENRDRQLWGVAECRVAGELSQEELSTLKEFVSGQASDGWGEGFEQREIRVDGGGGLYVHFWNSDQWSIQTEQELFAPKLDENQSDAPQMGGMTLG